MKYLLLLGFFLITLFSVFSRPTYTYGLGVPPPGVGAGTPTPSAGGGGCSAYVVSDDLNSVGKDGTGGLYYTPQNKISLYTSLVKGNDNDTKRVQIKLNDANGNTVYDKCGVLKGGQLYDKDTNQNPIPLGSFSSGYYYVQVNQQCNIINAGESSACHTDFNISPTGCDKPRDCANANQGSTAGPPPICAQSSNGKCLEVKTGFGFNIKTDAGSFVKTLFGIVLSIAGGIAVLLVIVSGYRIITSQGNPEKLQGAREQLTAAVVGLLFIIFSFVILQIIGVNMLSIFKG